MCCVVLKLPPNQTLERKVVTLYPCKPDIFEMTYEAA